MTVRQQTGSTQTQSLAPSVKTRWKRMVAATWSFADVARYAGLCHTPTAALCPFPKPLYMANPTVITCPLLQCSCSVVYVTQALLHCAGVLLAVWCSGRSHTWETISGHSCGRYKEDADKKINEAQRYRVEMHLVTVIPEMRCCCIMYKL